MTCIRRSGDAESHFVLFGAVFGAILGPVVFGPLFAGEKLTAEALMVPWFVAGGFMLVGLALVLAVRPDPKVIGQALASGRADRAPPPAAPLEILGRPGVVPALVAALASFSVMAALMNLVSYVVVHEHHHHQADVFPIIGAHVFGMYALVLVVGTLIDRIGRLQALVGGLLVMALSSASLVSAESGRHCVSPLHARDRLEPLRRCDGVPRRPPPSPNGELLGFSDLGSALLAAALVLGGFVVEYGPLALALGGTAIVLFPALGCSDRRPRPGGRLHDTRVSASLVEALTDATIGTTFNLSRRRRRPAPRPALRLPRAAGRRTDFLVAEAPGYRGTRMSAFRSRRSGSCPDRGRPRRPPPSSTASSTSSSCPTPCSSGTSSRRTAPPGPARLEQAADACRDRRLSPFLEELARGRRAVRSGALRMRSAARTSGIPRTAEPAPPRGPA